MPALLYSVPLTLQQASVNPCLSPRLLDSLRQIWLSLLQGHCSFLLGPGVHKVLFVLSKSLFPKSCGNSVIKFHWPQKSNSLGVLSLFCQMPRLVNPLKYSCLENPRDGGAWWAAICGVTQSRTWLKRLSSSSRKLANLLWALELSYSVRTSLI